MQRVGEWGMRGLAFLSLFVGALFQYWDVSTDIWFILNSGRFVVEHGIPYVEPLTMHEGLNYVMEQWLSAIAFWKVYSFFGNHGLLVFSFIIGCFVLYTYFRLCYLASQGNHAISTAMTMLFGSIASTLFFTTRPQIFSILLFIFEVYALERARDNKKWLSVIPIVSILLVNLHAALWIMTFILVLPYFVAFYKTMAKEMLVAIGTAVVTGFINPYGVDAMTFLFRSFSTEIHRHILEVQPPSFGTFAGAAFFICVFLVFAFIKKTMPLQYILLFAGTAFMGMMAARNEIFFYLIGTIPLAYALRDLELKSKGISPKITVAVVVVALAVLWSNGVDAEIPCEAQIFFIASAVCLLCFILFYREHGRLFDMESPVLRVKYSSTLFFLLLCLSFFPYYKSHHQENYGETQKPIIDYLLKNADKDKVVLWTGFNTGAYAGFRGVKYYIDARPEVFAPSNTKSEHNIIAEYFNVISGQEYYKDFFARHNFTHALVCEGDGNLWFSVQHDSDFELMFEHSDKDERYRLYRILK